MGGLNDNAKAVAVEVVYAAHERQYRLPLSVPAGTTVAEAIAISGILSRCPEIDFARNRVGIHGRRCSLQRCLHGSEGVRIEIYRPLLRDPTVLRQERAARNRGRR